MGTLDSILNFVIPPMIFVFVAWILYKAFKPMLEGLGGLFKKIFDKIKGESDDALSVEGYIEYE